MKTIGMSFFRKLLKDERGQTLPWVMFGMVAMLGMGGFTIDLGHFYVVRSELQNISDAAGLAAAGTVFDADSISNATNAVNASLADNPIHGLTENSGYPLITTPCLNSLMPNNTGCTNTAGGNAESPSVANAIRIKVQVSMPTYFMRIFGISSLTTTAETTASLLGPANNWNVAIILDATGSMSDTDSTCSGGSTSKMQCALQAVQGMLGAMQPCSVGVSTCTNAVANAHVALFAFPNILTTYLSNAFSCTPPGGTYPSPVGLAAWYQEGITLPKPGLTSYKPLEYQQTIGTVVTDWTSTYEITYPVTGTAAASDADVNGFVSDYYEASDAVTGNLNPSSSLVKAVGYSGTSTQIGCMPVSPNGIDMNGATNIAAIYPHITMDSGSVKDGQNVSTTTTNEAGTTTMVNTMGVGEGITYDAGAIYAAQAALVAEQALNVTNGMPAGRNAIILLSDGGMNTQWIYFPQGTMKPGNNAAPSTSLTTYTAPIVWPPTTAAPTGPPSTTSGYFAAASSTTASTIVSADSADGYDTLNTVPNYLSYVASAYTTLPAYEYFNGTSSEKYYNGTSMVVPAKIGGAYPSGLSASSGLYPDFIDECQQSIVAGQSAVSAGTVVFSVAYQAVASGCSSGSHAQDFTDVTKVATGTYNEGSYSAVTDVNQCNEMENIATSLKYFYSDSGTACVSADNGSTTDLKKIFGTIGQTFTTPRLLPNNAT